MRTFEQWMAEYAVSHRHPTNQMIHKICVPPIMLTVLGFLWAIPTPAEMSFISNWFNWATIFTFFCLVFYASLNLKMFLGMLIQVSLMLFIVSRIATTGYLIHFSAVVFVLAWIGQFYGHKIEGKKPSFLQDLAFLLIGPLWVQRFIFKKMGINV
ncbi:MAG: DUF962 domain-containing protein [Bacteriovoracaceae bacterium]|nr:DUF962 domain-containing protein [Bacteriovoracaceae bacterium]